VTSPFQLVKLGSRPLLAIPRASGRARIAAIGCYPAHTWKKRAVRSLLGLTVRCRLDRALWRETATPLDGVPAEELDAWIAEVRRQIGAPGVRPVFVWPADAARGRVYVYWLDDSGEVSAFGKLALDRKNSAHIETEQRTLETLAQKSLRRSRVPGIRAAGSLHGYSYLIVERAPVDARITQWETDAPIADSVREYAGPERRMSFAELEGMGWWQQFREAYRAHPAVLERLRRAAAAGLGVCRVHGDLNQTNILRTTDGIWLLDWERSEESGPSLTDAVCMEVDRLWPRTKVNAAEGLREFLASQWEGRSEADRDRVLLGLAYLCAAEFTPATALLEAWAPGLAADMG
jgi:hypothetical protein